MLVRETALAGGLGGAPFGEHRARAGASPLLGDAGVGHPVEVAVEQVALLLRRQVAIVRHHHVVVVRDEVEEILLEVCAGAADRVHLVAADHLGERQAELPGRHRPGERHHHLAAAASSFS
jgi:hypothetical protein